jgi:hypothetical protein
MNSPAVRSATVLLSLLVLAASGCDKKEDQAGDSTAAAGGGRAAGAGEPAAAGKPPERQAEEMVEHDLASADPEWSGWVVRGPKGARVMADGVNGARIAADGHDAFDLAFAPRKTDLAELKERLLQGAEASSGEMKLTFTSETPELLEWSAEGYGTTRYHFMMNMVAGDRDVTCQDNIMIGIVSEAYREAHKSACATLRRSE